MDKKHCLKSLGLLMAALSFAHVTTAQQTAAHWSFNYDYTVKNGVGTPGSTAVTGNGSVNLHNVRLKPNETFLPSDEATLTAYRSTIAVEANQVSAQDNKGAYLEVQAINCDGAALHMTSPVPTPMEANTSFMYGDKSVDFPDGKAYDYQNPYNYFEIEANTRNYKQDMELEVKAAGHNSPQQYYAIAYSIDRTTWKVVGDEYLTGVSYNQWVNQKVTLPIGKQEKAYIRIFPAKNWKGAGSNVNGDNQFDLDDVWLRGAFDASLARITDITIDGQTVTATDNGYECRLPKTYTEKTTTFRVTCENATLGVYAEEETSEDEVEVTDNGDGTYTLETPRANNATNITLTVNAIGDAVVVKKNCMLRLFHAGELQLRSLFVDGVPVDAAVRNAINTGDAYTATLSGNTYTTMPVVTAVANDGTEPEVTATLQDATAIYSIKGADRTFTLHVEGVYLYIAGDNDEEYRITYSADGKAAYEPQDQWTDGWTDGLYTLRTTNLDGWGGQQFKFNAADNLLEVPGGVVVKTFTLEKFGANYGDGEGLTSMTSEGATFRIPTKHGYTRGGRDNLTVVVENHKPGEPIAFTITGGNQPYAQLLLVIEKTNPGTTPKVMKMAANAVRNHAMVSVTFDREMAPCNVDFQGEEVHADTGTSLNFGVTGLDYNQAYTFTIPAGQAEDLFGNKTTEDIKVAFQTGEQQPVEKKAFDYVVGSAEEFTAAIKAIGTSTQKDLERITIFMKDGDYDFGENNEQRINRGYVSIIGQSRDGVLIHGTRTGISNPILNIRDREGFYLQDLTARNDLDFRAAARKGVGVAIYGGNKSVFKNVCMQSQQDTQVTGERSYFDHCRIQGTVDYICGGGDHFYDQCDLIMEGPGSVISAPATTSTTKWGYVFSHCTIDRAEAGAGATMREKGDYNLSRPWQNYPATYYLFTKMIIQPSDNGYTSMSNLPTRFYEYGSVDKDGNEIDLSVRGNSPTSTNTYTPVITAEEAKKFTIMNVLGGTDGWLPTDYTTLTKAPKAVANGPVISWENDPQVRCTVVFKDGKYVGNTADNSFIVSEVGTYTLRTANEMGGLSTEEAIVEVVSTGIDVVKASPVANGLWYNLSGQRVGKGYKGIVIVEGRKLLNN
jgi:hypothetical protein